jgi:hypothetical protein
MNRQGGGGPAAGGGGGGGDTASTTSKWGQRGALSEVEAADVQEHCLNRRRRAT